MGDFFLRISGTEFVPIYQLETLAGRQLGFSMSAQ